MLDALPEIKWDGLLYAYHAALIEAVTARKTVGQWIE